MAVYSHPVLRVDTDDVAGSVMFSPPMVEDKQLILESVGIKNDEIKELKKLHEEGVLTDDEFEKAKKKVLSQ